MAENDENKSPNCEDPLVVQIVKSCWLNEKKIQTNSELRRFLTLAKMKILVRLMVIRMPKNIISPLKITRVVLKYHHPSMMIITVLHVTETHL